jgi:hypothetical protein
MKTDKLQEQLMYEKQSMNAATLNSSKNSNRKRPQTGSLNARGGHNSSKGSKIDVAGSQSQ